MSTFWRAPLILIIEIVFNAVTVLKFFIIFEQQALHFILCWGPEIAQLGLGGGGVRTCLLSCVRLLPAHLPVGFRPRITRQGCSLDAEHLEGPGHTWWSEDTGAQAGEGDSSLTRWAGWQVQRCHLDSLVHRHHPLPVPLSSPDLSSHSSWAGQSSECRPVARLTLGTINGGDTKPGLLAAGGWDTCWGRFLRAGRLPVGISTWGPETGPGPGDTGRPRPGLHFILWQENRNVMKAPQAYRAAFGLGSAGCRARWLVSFLPRERTEQVSCPQSCLKRRDSNASAQLRVCVCVCVWPQCQTWESGNESFGPWSRR